MFRFLLSLFLLFFSVEANAAAPLEQLRRAPEISGPMWFNRQDSKAKILKELEGRVVIVVFWATDDPYTRKIMEFVNEKYAHYKKRGLEAVGVRAMDWGYESSEDSIAQEVKDFQIKFPVVLDVNAAVWVSYGQISRPALSLIDREGVLRASYSAGIEWHRLDTQIAALVEEGRSKFKK